MSAQRAPFRFLLAVVLLLYLVLAVWYSAVSYTHLRAHET